MMCLTCDRSTFMASSSATSAAAVASAAAPTRNARAWEEGEENAAASIERAQKGLKPETHTNPQVATTAGVREWRQLFSCCVGVCAERVGVRERHTRTPLSLFPNAAHKRF